MKAGIYQFRNTITNDLYIGSSNNIRYRRNTHLSRLSRNCHQNAHLQSAWNKYGKQSFVFEILIYCDEHMLIFYEQRFIDYYKPSYNISPTAGSCTGMRRTEQEKEHLRQVNKGRKMTEANKKALHIANTGRPMSDYTKKKIRESLLGKHISSEHKEKISQANKENTRASKTFTGFVSPLGQVYKEITNLPEFAKQYGLSHSHLIQVNLRHRKSHKGWTKYEPSSNKI